MTLIFISFSDNAEIITLSNPGYILTGTWIRSGVAGIQNRYSKKEEGFQRGGLAAVDFII